MENTGLRWVIKCICHKGFSGHSSVVARSNFCVVGIETTQQSITAHTTQPFLIMYKKTGAIINTLKRVDFVIK